MGTEAAWVPWVLAATGAATGAYADRQQAKSTDRALAQQIDNSAAKTREANQRVSEAITETGQNSAGAERNSAMQQYVAQLRATNGSATRGLGQQGGASGRFNEEATQAALGVSDYGMERAGTAATIDSILRQRDNEGAIRSRTGVDVGNIARKERMQSFLDNLRVRSAASGNGQQWLRALSGGLNGAAGATAGMGGSNMADTGAGMYDPDAYARYAQTSGFNFNF